MSISYAFLTVLRWTPSRSTSWRSDGSLNPPVGKELELVDITGGNEKGNGLCLQILEHPADGQKPVNGADHCPACHSAQNTNGQASAETTVNWTTPGDGRNQQGQGNQSARFQHSQGQEGGFPPYGSQPQRQDYYGGNSYQGCQGSGDKRQNRSNRGRFAKRVAGITAAAVLFGTVSGGVMTGVNYLGNRLTRNLRKGGTGEEILDICGRLVQSLLKRNIVIYDMLDGKMDRGHIHLK